MIVMLLHLHPLTVAAVVNQAQQANTAIAAIATVRREKLMSPRSLTPKRRLNKNRKHQKSQASLVKSEFCSLYILIMLYIPYPPFHFDYVKTCIFAIKHLTLHTDDLNVHLCTPIYICF